MVLSFEFCTHSLGFLWCLQIGCIGSFIYCFWNNVFFSLIMEIRLKVFVVFGWQIFETVVIELGFLRHFTEVINFLVKTNFMIFFSFSIGKNFKMYELDSRHWGSQISVFSQIYLLLKAVSRVCLSLIILSSDWGISNLEQRMTQPKKMHFVTTVA